MFERDPAAGRRGPLGRSSAAGGSSRTATSRAASRSSARPCTASATSSEKLRRHGHGRLQRRPLRPPRDAAAAPPQARHGLATCSCGPAPHEKRLPGPLFWWESPDGSRVLAYRIPYEYCTPRRGPGRPARQVARRSCRTPLRRDDGVLRRRQPRRRADAREHRVDPHGSTASARCRSCPQHAASGSSPRSASSGRRASRSSATTCSTTRSAATRRTPASSAGTAGPSTRCSRPRRGRPSAAGHDGAGLPARRPRPGWKHVLFNQFHDILGGHRDRARLRRRPRPARRGDGDRGPGAQRRRSSRWRPDRHPDRAGTTPIVVFNPHAWPVRTTVETEFGGLKATDGLRRRRRAAGAVPGDPVLRDRVRVAAAGSLRRGPAAARLPDVPGHAGPVAASAEDGVRATTDQPGERAPAPGARPEDRRDPHLLPARGRSRRRSISPTRRRPRAVVVDDTSDTWGHRRLALPGRRRRVRGRPASR